MPPVQTTSPAAMDAERAGAPEPEEMLRYTDKEIVELIRGELDNGEADESDAIQSQRRDAFSAYYGNLPGRARAGRSSHVSREVFDAVESVKAKMLRIFSSNRIVAKFDAHGSSPSASKEADLKTSYVNHIFRKKNSGYELLEDALHDALLSKICIFKRWYHEDEDVETEVVDNVPLQELQGYLAQNPDLTLSKITSRQILPQIVQTPMGAQSMPVEIVSAEIERVMDTSYTRVGVVPPEDFFMGSRGTGTRNSDFLADRTEYSKQELIGFGYDEDVVDSLSTDSTLLSDFMDASRRSVDRSWRASGNDARKDDRELVTVWDVYMLIDLNMDGKPEWWQFVIGGTELLSKEQVKGHPYRTWSPYSISHKGIGMSVADVTIDLQKTMSSIIRGGVDNVWLTNNSQKAANLKTITNPQDLISGRIGAIIDTPSPDGIVPIMQPQLSNATFALYEKLEQQKEARLGVSRLSQGLNQDAISNQNAQDMIDKLMAASNERIVQMARGFAEKCFKPLMNDLYTLGVENNEQVRAVFQGEMQDIAPDNWDPESEISITVALTPEEQAAQAQTLLTVHGVLSADEGMAPLYSMEQKYAVVSDALDLLGVNNPTYLANPADPAVQERMKLRAAKMEADMEEEKARQNALIAMQVELAVAQQRTRERAQQSREMKDTADTAIKRQSLELDAAHRSDQQALDEREFDHQVFQDDREYELERVQDRPVAI